MPEICTNITNVCAGGNHGQVTVGGVTYENPDMVTAPTADELATFHRVGLWKLRQKGLTFQQFKNRVVIGEEATNVKSYTFFGPGAEIPKSNIGATPINVLPGSDGQEILIDFTGCTEFRPRLNLLLGTGTWGFQLIRTDGTVLYNSPNVSTVGEQVLDPGWIALPAGFDSEQLIRVQCGSSAIASATIRRAAVAVR